MAIGLCTVAGAALLALAAGGCGSTAATITNAASAADQGIVKVVLTSPTNGSVTSADHITLRGTVTPANAVVQIQGQPAAVGNGVFTGTATLHGGKTTIDVIGSAPGATPGSASVSIVHPSPRAASPVPRAASDVPTPAAASGNSEYWGQSDCGGGLSVGPNTTCAFAENVRSAYDESGPGTVVAYSPVTNRSYAMNCSSGGSVECTGANNASVYFSGDYSGTAYEASRPYSDSATPTVANAGGDYSGESACGDELSAGPNTTCAFAENVRSAYDADGPGAVTAYSPVTNRTYVMTCSSGSSVECTGANNAAVYFP
jgi:hypothetical protein